MLRNSDDRSVWNVYKRASVDFAVDNRKVINNSFGLYPDTYALFLGTYPLTYPPFGLILH